MIEEALKFPTVHGNGTSRSQLLEQHTGAAYAVQIAMEAVTRASPNGRDYPQGNAALWLAIMQHDSRVTRLRSVYEELQNICEAIQE